MLELCDGSQTGSDVARLLCERHPGSAEVFDEFHDFLQQLDTLGALRFDPEVP